MYFMNPLQIWWNNAMGKEVNVTDHEGNINQNDNSS